MNAKPPKPADRPANPRFKVQAPERVNFEKEFQPILTAFTETPVFRENKLDDTTAAILATNILDDFLRLSIVLRLRKHPTTTEMAELFGYSGPLGTFSGRVTFCSLAGLVVGDMKHDLRLIGEIRNRFAHSPTLLQFRSQEIAWRCGKLQRSVDLKATIESIERKRFLSSVMSIILGMAGTIAFALAEVEMISENWSSLSARAQEKLNAVTKQAGVSPESAV